MAASSIRPALRKKVVLNPRVLFLLKYRDLPDNPLAGATPHVKGYGLSSGLLNSATFVVDMLAHAGYAVKLVQVVDNNSIDAEVAKFLPNICVIEALWVVPEKFEILQRLHPSVKWIVRGHSEIPFLANEGVALKWLTGYMAYERVVIAANSSRSLRDLRAIIQSANPELTESEIAERVIYLPNFYPTTRKYRRVKAEDQFLDVACFGAIRPLKNQLMQGAAAIRYAESIHKVLRFHVNASRTEQKGDNVLKNLRALFGATNHGLVEHGWTPHRDFMYLLSHMDLAMQVSFTETFNIICADCVMVGLPTVGSSEIPWLHAGCQASPTDSRDIVKKLKLAHDYSREKLRKSNLSSLRRYCEKSKAEWLAYLN
jgi:hypothetical protein